MATATPAETAAFHRVFRQVYGNLDPVTGVCLGLNRNRKSEDSWTCGDVEVGWSPNRTVPGHRYLKAPGLKVWAHGSWVRDPDDLTYEEGTPDMLLTLKVG